MGDAVTDEKIDNYNRSYKSMWQQIGEAREQRDKAYAFSDLVHDLIISMRHDMRDGTTKVSLKTMEAIDRLEKRITDLKGEPDVSHRQAPRALP